MRHLGHVDVAVGPAVVAEILLAGASCPPTRTWPPPPGAWPWRPGRRCWSTPRCRAPACSRCARWTGRGRGRRSRCRRPSRRRRRSRRCGRTRSPASARSRRRGVLGDARQPRAAAGRPRASALGHGRASSRPGAAASEARGTSSSPSSARERLDQQPSGLGLVLRRARGACPRPNSALSSNSELAQAGPRPVGVRRPRRGGQVAAVDRRAAGGVGHHHAVAEELGDAA